jgi:hypothetical protein
MSIRHYICVDEPIEKLTYKKIKTFILKPLMFPLRMERYCVLGTFPLTIAELRKALEDDEKFLVDVFCHEAIFSNAIYENHKDLLSKMHSAVIKKILYEV